MCVGVCVCVCVGGFLHFLAFGVFALTLVYLFVSLLMALRSICKCVVLTVNTLEHVLGL